MTLVYRVELKRYTDDNIGVGMGVYQDSNIGIRLDESSDNPLPWEEVSIKVELIRRFGTSYPLKKEYYCCFSSEEDLKRWFKGLYDKEVIKHALRWFPEIRINVYRSQDVIQGEYQALFKGEEAELTHSYPIDIYVT